MNAAHFKKQLLAFTLACLACASTSSVCAAAPAEKPITTHQPQRTATDWQAFRENSQAFKEKIASQQASITARLNFKKTAGGGTEIFLPTLQPLCTEKVAAMWLTQLTNASSDALFRSTRSTSVDLSRWPLNAFSECDSDTCALARRNSKLRRNLHEQFKKLITSDFIGNKSGPFVYTSFGGGTGVTFTDIINLSWLIHQNPKRKFRINFIDIAFKDLRDDKEFAHGLQWLQSLGGKNITFVTYDNADNYITDCRNNPDLKSDIIVGIDYVNTPGLGGTEITEYYSAKAKNPHIKTTDFTKRWREVSYTPTMKDFANLREKAAKKDNLVFDLSYDFFKECAQLSILKNEKSIHINTECKKE